VESKADRIAKSERRRRSLFLASGEGLSAFAGVAFLAVLAAVLTATGWWTVRVHRDARREDDDRRISAVGTLLATSAEALLERDEVSLLRGLVLDTVRRERLAECRIQLRDGTLVADSDTKKLASRTLPERWPAGPAASQDRPGWRVFPMEVRGRGAADLLIRGDQTWSPWGDAKVQFGLGAIAVGGLVLMLVAYRAIRMRARGVGAVAESVVLAGEGEMALGALRVHEGWGRVAKAWNHLAEERERLLAETQIERAIGTAASGGKDEGDLAAIVDTITDGLVLIDEQQRVRRANGAAAILLQAKREQLVGTELRRLISSDEVLAAAESVLSGKSRQSVMVEVQRDEPGGAGSVLRFRVRPIRYDSGSAAMIVIEDVTQQRVADQARNAFVAQATHELRTPLTNIRLYMDALLDGEEQDAASRAKALNVVSQEARRLERIVSDMLSVSEIEAGSMKLVRGDVRLEALFEELQNDYRAMASDKEIALEFNLPPKWPQLEADRDKLSLAIHNLLGNALKYTPPGGRVVVQVEETPDGLAVEVRDNGIGIRADEHEKIFDRFYRAKDKRLAGITGSGLGLALAREIARMHGGDITLKSELDKGSTFRLIVPLQPVGAGSGLAKAA
jgi:PAS domain S-box-containing protein